MEAHRPKNPPRRKKGVKATALEVHLNPPSSTTLKASPVKGKFSLEGMGGRVRQHQKEGK